LDALLDGRLGILVNPGDTHGLADAIVRMLQGDVEPHLLDPIYLRETVLAHYGFDRFMEQVGVLLETVLGGSLK
jgi:glycosyltransferase involved in cell wall biosynthesis